MILLSVLALVRISAPKTQDQQLQPAMMSSDRLRAPPFTQTCTGKSKNLPQEQCNAWGAFYNSTGGKDSARDNWVNCGYNNHPDEPDGQTDPCSCPGASKKHNVCNQDGTMITQMCVCRRVAAAAIRPLASIR